MPKGRRESTLPAASRGNTVAHKAKAAMLSDWIATDLKRDFIFHDNTLALYGP
ncbi:MAG: hypothetical protein WC373_15815 [Smithella sp.]